MPAPPCPSTLRPAFVSLPLVALATVSAALALWQAPSARADGPTYSTSPDGTTTSTTDGASHEPRPSPSATRGTAPPPSPSGSPTATSSPSPQPTAQPTAPTPSTAPAAAPPAPSASPTRAPTHASRHRAQVPVTAHREAVTAPEPSVGRSRRVSLAAAEATRAVARPAPPGRPARRPASPRRHSGLRADLGGLHSSPVAVLGPWLTTSALVGLAGGVVLLGRSVRRREHVPAPQPPRLPPLGTA